MTTVTAIVRDALEDANIIGAGDTPDGDLGARALTLLNQMLALWQTDNLFVYGQQIVSFTPTGALSYTLGATGADVTTARPEKIEAAWWRSDGIDYPLTVLDTFTQYQCIPQKTQAGEPSLVYYEPSSYTLGTLYLYPQPSAGSIRLLTQLRLPQPASLAGTLELPPEYMLPIRSNLAVLLAGTNAGTVSPMIQALAANSLRLLRRNNVRLQSLPMPDGVPTQARSNIFTG